MVELYPEPTQAQTPEATLLGTLDTVPAGQGTGGPVGESCEQNDTHGAWPWADDKGVRPSRARTTIVMQSILLSALVRLFRCENPWFKQGTRRVAYMVASRIVCRNVWGGDPYSRTNYVCRVVRPSCGVPGLATLSSSPR